MKRGATVWIIGTMLFVICAGAYAYLHGFRHRPYRELAERELAERIESHRTAKRELGELLQTQKSAEELRHNRVLNERNPRVEIPPFDRSDAQDKLRRVERELLALHSEQADRTVARLLMVLMVCSLVLPFFFSRIRGGAPIEAGDGRLTEEMQAQLHAALAGQEPRRTGDAEDGPTPDPEVFDHIELDTEEAWRTLDLPLGAPLEEVERAWAEKNAEYDPDRLAYLPPDFQEEAQAQFEQYKWAYEQLRRHFAASQTDPESDKSMN